MTRVTPHTSPSVGGFRHGRVPREVREHQILEVAEELFVERGYEGASMDELARRAGVSKPVIYDLVGSKEELFRRCFEISGDELFGRIAEAAAAPARTGDAHAILRATAIAFFDFVNEHGRAWDMLFSLDTGGRTARAVAEIRARQAAFASAMLEALARERGVALDPERRDVVAHALNGAYDALAQWLRKHPDTPTPQVAGWLADLALPGIEALLR